MSHNVVIGAICLLGLPILFAWLANTFVNLLIFLHGGTVGLVVTLLLSAQSWNNLYYHLGDLLPGAAVVGIICGLVAISINRFWIIVSSSALGSALVAAGSGMTGTSSSDGYVPIIAIGTICGAVFQYALFWKDGPSRDVVSGKRTPETAQETEDQEARALREIFRA